jgi:uncharacterized cupin superfamily protein
MPKLDLASIEEISRTSYPQPFAADMTRRHFRRLAPAGGIRDFGVSYVRLEPGGWSSQRHWHEEEDEFVAILSGEAVLIEDGSETPMRAGDCAVFPKGTANGHHLVNRGDRECVFIAVGAQTNGTCHYSDIDMKWDGPSQSYVHRDDTPY